MLRPWRKRPVSRSPRLGHSEARRPQLARGLFPAEAQRPGGSLPAGAPCCSAGARLSAWVLAASLASCSKPGDVTSIVSNRTAPPPAPATTQPITQAECPARATLRPGQSEHRLESAGRQRRFVLVVPERLPPGRSALVLNLHGSGGSPVGQLETSRLGRMSIGGAGAAVVAAPAGLGAVWNVPVDADGPDDVRFASDVIDAVDRLLCIDRRRVYATGFSGGGRMVSQLACDLSSRIAAIASVGGIRFPGPCREARALPILAIHGDADPVNPYSGGGRPYWGTGVEPAVEGWAAHHGCPERRLEQVAAGVERIAYGGKGCGAPVLLYRIAGFGHTWPREVSFGPDAARRGTTQLLASFFRAHPGPVEAASP